LQQKHTEIEKLIEVSQKILSSFDTKNILDFILSSLKTLVDYNAAAVFLLDKGSRQLLNTSSKGYDAALINRLHLKVGQGACGWVVETKKIDVLDDIRQTEHYYEIRPQTRSQVSIPLLFDESVLGVLCLESDSTAFFNAERIRILQLFSSFASIAIRNAQHMQILLEKKAYEHELIHAAVVQKRLLVQQLPQFKKLEINAVNIPSKIVSGDLYDVIKYNESTVGIAIGDVSGKGAPAALMMTLILAAIRSQKKTFLNVCDSVYRLNNLLYESTIEGKYATFFFAIISLEKNRLIYTNAGHNPPIFIKANSDIVRLTQGGVVLGFQADQEYIQNTIELSPGDLLLAYTDGVTETMNAAEEEFGEERLIKLVLANRERNAFELRELILSELNSFSGFENPADDITLVICKYL